MTKEDRIVVSCKDYGDLDVEAETAKVLALRKSSKLQGPPGLVNALDNGETATEVCALCAGKCGFGPGHKVALVREYARLVWIGDINLDDQVPEPLKEEVLIEIASEAQHPKMRNQAPMRVRELLNSVTTREGAEAHI